jgi:hypothetical protein
MRKQSKAVTRGQIRDALETTYREYFGEFRRNRTFEEAVQGFLDGEVEPVEIIETIQGVVHQLAEKDRHDLAWHWEALLADEDRTYSGSFSVVLVDAHTAKCLTYFRIAGQYPVPDYTFHIRTVEDVVRAVAYLLALLGVHTEWNQ